MPPLSACHIDVEFQTFKAMLLLAVALFAMRLKWASNLIPIGRWRIRGGRWRLITMRAVNPC